MAKGGARDGAGRKAGVPNKATADIKAVAQEYGASALETLASIMGSTESPAAARVAAAQALLDRGYGKPKQSLDVAAEINSTIREIRRTVVDPQHTNPKGVSPAP